MKNIEFKTLYLLMGLFLGVILGVAYKDARIIEPRDALPVVEQEISWLEE